MNILLTSVGRRAYLVNYFKAALKKNGGGQVHVANSDSLSVAFQYADKKVISPLIYDENYIPFLLEYCEKNNISICIPLFDIDVLVLAKNRSKFDEIGTEVVVSSENFVANCNDKWRTYLFLRERGFEVPITFKNIDDVRKAIKNGRISYPLIIKPRFGCGSLSVQVVETDNELEISTYLVEKEIMDSYLKYESCFMGERVLYQQLLQGQEYGVDIINDLNGNFQNAIIKKKLAMRSGETDIAKIIFNQEIFSISKKLSAYSRHIGNLDCDVFESDGKVYILEMNARFGGGYPFSYMAGCDLPEAIVRWYMGSGVSPELLQAKNNVMGFKEISITMSEG